MHPDEATYWVRALDEAHAFMATTEQHPIADCLDPVVPIEPAARAAGVPLVCLTTPHPSGRPRDHRIRQANVEPLLAAAWAFADRGLTLVLEDSLRSPAAQAQTAASPAVVETLAAILSAADPQVTDEQIIHRLGAMVAATPATAGHVAGAAIDITVRDADGRELDRGAPYLDLSARMPMASPYLTPGHKANRALITDVMTTHGFVAYPYEFWHYSRGDGLAATAIADSRPAIFGPVHVARDGITTPLPTPHEPFNPPSLLIAAVRRAMHCDTNP
jgi:D-alanyl-D-alanine dipeptidase